MEYLYNKSFSELERVFRTEFKQSKVFENMILELFENVIEYKFLHQADLIRNE